MEHLKPFKENPLNFKNPQFKGYKYYESHFNLPQGTSIRQIKNYAQEKSNILRVQGKQTDGFFQVSIKYSSGEWMTTKGTKPGYAVSVSEDYDNREDTLGTPIGMRLMYTYK